MNPSSCPVISQLQTKQQCDYLPEYTYSTAFGSLLTNLNCTNRCVDISRNQPVELCDNSCNRLYRSVQHVLKTLIDLLDELSLHLDSLIKCQLFLSECQLKTITNGVEQLCHFRSSLQMQFNHINGSFRDVSSVSCLLENLDSFICNLSKQQESIFIPYSQTAILTQLLNRVSATIKVCIDCITRDSNPQVDWQASAPIMFPYTNYPRVFVEHPIVSSQYLLPCDGSTICLPWSVVEQMKQLDGRNNTFGLMYDIEDVNIRHKPSSKNERYKPQKRAFRKALKQKSSIDAEHTAAQQTSTTPTTRKHSIAQHQATDEGISRTSRTSTPSQREEDTTNRLDESQNMSRQQSTANSKQSTPLLTKLPTSAKSGHSDSRHPSSRLTHEQLSEVHTGADEHHGLWSPMSFQSEGYRTPSKTAIKMSRDSSQSSSPTLKKSANRHSLSTISSMTGTKHKTRVSGVTSNEDKQSRQKHIDPSLNSYQTFADNGDPAMIFKSDGRIEEKESGRYPNWEQRLVSPLSLKSTHHINSAHVERNITTPVLSNQSLMDDTGSHLNFDSYSKHQVSQSSSSRYQTNGSSSKQLYHTSPLTMIGSSKSEKENEEATDYLQNNKQQILTAQFSSVDAYHQRSTSATSDSESSSIFSDRIIKPKTSPVPLASDKEGYLIKFRNCFRRKNVNRIDLLKQKKK